MNVYFLVEGRRTEKKIYPKWLTYLAPHLTQITEPFRLDSEPDLDDTFYIFVGNGFPSLLDNHLANAIKDVDTIKRIDYLVICLDSDNLTVKESKQYVNDFIAENGLKLNSAELVIIVQNNCIETWLLGNRKVYSRNCSSQKLVDCMDHYCVKEKDPELMPSIDRDITISQFHFSYLREMLENKNISYTKNNPREVVERHYLEELINRQEETKHLSSFKDFLDFCKKL